MNFTALDIIHLWTDSHGKAILKVFPSNKRIYVWCASDLSREAAKVCGFVGLIVKHPWTFQMEKENERFVITFFPETVNLENLFVQQKSPAKRERKSRGMTVIN